MKTQNKTKRIKQVFRTSAEVAQVFAAGTQEYAKSTYNSRNGDTGLTRCYFKGRDYFSFGPHYLLARKGLALNGVPFVFVNESHYSRMTREQQGEAIRALSQVGFSVLTASHENCGFNEDTGDLEILAAVVNELETRGNAIAESLLEMQFKPYNNWLIDDCLKDAKQFNEMVTKFKLEYLKVELPTAEMIRNALDLYTLTSAATQDHASREQLRFFHESSYQTYAESRRVQRRTA